MALSKGQFEHVNGFSNQFYGWGGEDDDMYRRSVGVYCIGRSRQCSRGGGGGTLYEMKKTHNSLGAFLQ